MIKRFEVSEETTLQEVFEYIKVKYNEIPDLEDKENFLKAIVREVDYENKQKLRQYIIEGGRYHGGNYIIPENKTKGYYGVEDIDVVNYFLEQTVPLMEEEDLIEMLLSDTMQKDIMSPLNQDDVDFLTEFARVCDYIGGLPTSYSLQAQDLSSEIKEVLCEGYWTSGRYRYDEYSMSYELIHNRKNVQLEELDKLSVKGEFTGIDRKRIIEIYGNVCFDRGILPLFGDTNSEMLRNNGYIDTDLPKEKYESLVKLTRTYIENIPVLPYNVTGRLDLPVIFHCVGDWKQFLTNGDNASKPAMEIVKRDLGIEKIDIKSPLQYCLKSNIAPIIMANLCDEDVYKILDRDIVSDRILKLYIKEIRKCYKEQDNIKVLPKQLYDVTGVSCVVPYNIHREVLRLSNLRYALLYQLVRLVGEEFESLGTKFRFDLEYKKEAKDLIDLLDDILIDPDRCKEALPLLDKFMRNLMRS